MDRIQTEKYPAYKDSGVEWLGDIPSHWNLKKFKFLAEIQKGKLPFKIVSTNETGLPPYMSMEYLRGGEEIQWVLDKSAKIIDENETLLLWDGSNAGEFIKSKKGVISSTIAYISFYDIDNNFAWYYSKFIEIELRGKTIGMGIPHVNGNELRNFIVSLPPLPEQTAIAQFLDRKTALIDKAIAIKEKQIELLKERRQILIHKAVTRGLNPNVKMKDSGVEWIGEIPGHWNIKELRYLKKLGTEITYGIVQAGPDIPNGIPYIRTGDMYGEDFPISGYLKTSERIASSFHRSKVSKGDLVVAIRATLGKALLVPEHLEGANLTQGTAKICAGPEVNNVYLFWVFNSYYVQTEIEFNAKGTTFKEITLNKLRRLSITLPGLEEQNRILRYIENINGLIATATSLKVKETEKLREYKASLINSAITGKIKVC